MMANGKILSMALTGKPGIIQDASGKKYAFTKDQVAAGHLGMPLLPKTEVQFEPGDIAGQMYATAIRPGSVGSQQPSYSQTKSKMHHLPQRQPNDGIHQGKPPATAQPSHRKAPYTFVPVVIANHDGGRPLFPAGFHDGRGTGQRLSGELHLELTAQTPLLVGQYRYTLGQSQQQADYPTDKPILEPAILNLAAGGCMELHGQKLSANDWALRRVLIPGSSVKGLLRQSISAMLNAPMERVAEHWFSYRPNLEWSEGQRRYQCREAIVVHLDPLRVKVLGDERHAIMVQRANGSVPPLVHGHVITAGTKIPNYQINIQKYRLEYSNGNQEKPSRDHLVVPYRGGTDGLGELASTFTGGQGSYPKKTYQTALIPLDDINSGDEKPIPVEILEQYQETSLELGNEKFGHLAGHPGNFGTNDTESDLKKAKIRTALSKTSNTFQLNQLIYVEIDTDQDNRIVSLGHNFRYRWRYADSVRRHDDGQAVSRSQHPHRPELSPLAGEQVDLNGDTVSGKLSGARLLFGYAIDKSDESGNAGIGNADFERLAGRIAINHAIEVVEDAGSAPEHRFVRLAGATGDSAWLLPLKILGQPKPSAVEHYLDQAGVEKIQGATRTYGDLPGVPNAEPGATLNGRKFYRHQSVTIGHDGSIAQTSPCLATTADDRESAQATLARFASRPGARFRFTLRFRDLAPWELGAVLVALQPELLANADDHLVDAETKADLARPGQAPSFALKLGYARPLGFGSVTFSLNSYQIIEQCSELAAATLDSWQTDLAKQLIEVVSDKRAQLRDWLRAVRWYQDGNIGYPVLRPKPQAEETIFDYHTRIRRAHSDQRRRPSPLPANQQPGLAWPIWPDEGGWEHAE